MIYKINNLEFHNTNLQSFLDITLLLIFNNKNLNDIRNSNTKLNFITNHYYDLYLANRFDSISQLTISRFW